MSMQKHFYIGPVVICDAEVKKIDEYPNGWHDFTIDVLANALVSLSNEDEDKGIPKGKLVLFPNRIKHKFFSITGSECQLPNPLIDLMKLNLKQELKKFNKEYATAIKKLKQAGANPKITYVTAEYSI